MAQSLANGAEVPWQHGSPRATGGAGSPKGTRGVSRTLDDAAHETKLAAAD
jgi:hypothetical protein